MQMVIDEPNICNQTGRVYFCINGNESSVCHVRLYNTPHSDDGIIALFEEKTTLYLGSDGLVNRLYVIRRYFSKRLVFHSRNIRWLIKLQAIKMRTPFSTSSDVGASSNSFSTSSPTASFPSAVETAVAAIF